MGERVKTLGESPDALRPMENLFQAMRAQIARERNQDPVPQFDTSEIERTTASISWALASMKKAFNYSSPEGLAAYDDDGLKRLGEDVRQSCIDLNLLISDSTTALRGEQARGAFELTRETQSHIIKRSLQDFSNFMGNFGIHELLGSRYKADPRFKDVSEQVIRLLSALQKPTKVLVPPSHYTDEDAWGYDANPRGPRHSPFYTPRPWHHHDHSPNPRPAENKPAAMQLNELARMAEEFAAECSVTAKDQSLQMLDLETKMQALRTFLEVLLEAPDVYRRFALFHISKMKDPARMKPWLRKEEAMASLQDFERLRDAIVEERALRRLSSSSRGAKE